MSGPWDPEEAELGESGRPAALPPNSSVGLVSLTVARLQRSLEFYEQSIGLQVLERDGGIARLGVGRHALLELTEEPLARPLSGHSGLYHFALLLPERVELARWLAHAARTRVPMSGVADHFVSEALYLSDPDQHGIEIYWDRPRAGWDGLVAERMTTAPLDLEDLLGELEDPASAPFEGLPEGTGMGHIHLRVARIPETVAFYRGVLGFELMAELGGRAAFLSAGGYHHHIGANSWESAEVRVPGEGTATLRRATIVLPDEAAREQVLARVSESGQEPREGPGGALVEDPSGIELELVLATGEH